MNGCCVPFITGDVSSYYLAKVMSARFSTVKLLSMSPLLIVSDINILWGDNLN